MMGIGSSRRTPGRANPVAEDTAAPPNCQTPVVGFALRTGRVMKPLLSRAVIPYDGAGAKSTPWGDTPGHRRGPPESRHALRHQSPLSELPQFVTHPDRLAGPADPVQTLLQTIPRSTEKTIGRGTVELTAKRGGGTGGPADAGSI